MRRARYLTSTVATAALLQIFIVQAVWVQAAFAQTETPGAGQQSAPSVGQEANPADVARLELNDEQRHAIYVSVSSQNNKDAAPPAFLPKVGAVIPGSVTLRPLPDAILKLVLRLKDYQQAFVANQVVIADPADRKIVETINR